MPYPRCSIAIMLLSGSLLAAQEPEQGAFLVRLGTDTVAVEQFTRDGDRVEGRCIVRTPRTVVRDYTVTLGPDERPVRFELHSAPQADRESGAIPFTGAHAGATPYIPNCWGLLELATRRALRTGDSTASVVALTPGRDEPRTITVERQAGDSLSITVIEGVPYRVTADGAGRIRGAAWAGEWSVQRLPALDLAALRTEFERRPLGTLSPADSVTATVGPATISIQYSRPGRRGRVVFGGVVPWHKVWRTGANEATLFTTSADLDFGGTLVPAGTYTLWTVPGPSRWKLIINRNTGQWGTDYDASHDLARIDMAVARPAGPVEQFTIGIESRGQSGALVLEWENTKVSAAFRPRAELGSP
jgi:hypothetical protein